MVLFLLVIVGPPVEGFETRDGWGKIVFGFFGVFLQNGDVSPLGTIGSCTHSILEIKCQTIDLWRQFRFCDGYVGTTMALHISIDRHYEWTTIIVGKGVRWTQLAWWKPIGGGCRQWAQWKPSTMARWIKNKLAAEAAKNVITNEIKRCKNMVE